jgi:hypothetical protein
MVLNEELSRLTEGNEDSARTTLENIYELAKMSHTKDTNFFKDFGQIHGIRRVLEFLNRHKARRGQQIFGDPECMLVAANLTYLCVMRGPKAKEISDAFVELDGVELFLKANALFVLEEGSGTKKRSESRMDNTYIQEHLKARYKASSAIWVALGMIFCKSGSLMTKEQHLKAIDSILDSMDKLGDITKKAREQNKSRQETWQHATKTLHGVYRSLNYLIDHVNMTKEEIDSRRLFQRCHAVAKTPTKNVSFSESTTKSKTKTRIASERYKTEDATLFLNTKIFFVSCFQKGLLQSRAHFEEAVPLCVETIKRNSCKASTNFRAQDRRHNVFDMMVASCKKVHKTTLEKSGILGAIEATLLAEGTVKSSSKQKAREVLKALVAVL